MWLRYNQERASQSLEEIWNLNGISKLGWVKNPIQIPRKMNLNCEARELVDHERLPSCQRLGFHVDSPSGCGNHPTRLLRHRELGEIGFLLPPERRKVLRRRRNQVEFSEIEFLLQHPLAVVTQGLLHQVRHIQARQHRGSRLSLVSHRKWAHRHRSRTLASNHCSTHTYCYPTWSQEMYS